MNIGPDSRAGRFTKLEKDWILYDVANSAGRGETGSSAETESYFTREHDG